MGDDIYYILENKTPIVTDSETWSKFLKNVGNRKIGDDRYEGVHISTVFLGLDHNYSKVGPPILFETMIFGGEHNDYQERYATWDEAVAGHQQAKQMVLASLKNV